MIPSRPHEPNDASPTEEKMREITDKRGRTWTAFAQPTMVAHMRSGALLAFRAADDPTVQVPASPPVDWNSLVAAEAAINTMGDLELKRRIEWAKTAAGIA